LGSTEVDEKLKVSEEVLHFADRLRDKFGQTDGPLTLPTRLT
jgi:hypothetical protein